MNKTILITGASGGLGRSVTQRFLNDNYTVVASSHSDPKGNDSPGLVNIQADLTIEKDTNAFVNKAISEFGPIPAAALLVGGFAMGNIQKTHEKELQEQYHLNFLTTWFCVKPLFKHMMDNGFGRLVLIGSVPGQNPGLGQEMVAYTLSKSLIFALAEILNAEGKDKNVFTSVIVPGTIDTPANRKAMPEADFSKWVKPESLAETIFAVCTDESSENLNPVFQMYSEE